MRVRYARRRRGAIVPLVAISLVAILGMVALAIDIGMVAVAKTQAQNAADSAAMVGARTFNQEAGFSLTSVPKMGVTAATANKIFGVNITGDPTNVTSTVADTYTSGAVTIECGGYYYVYNDANPSAEGFQIVIPNKLSTEPYTAVRSTITTTSPVFFGAVFGASPFNVKAQAVAAHRPRDVVIVLDLSGSMRFQSCPGGYLSGGNVAPQSSPRNVSLNGDSLVPTFGHYSSASAALIGTSGYPVSTGEYADLSNMTATSVSGPTIIADFMSSGSTPAFVFDSSKSGYATTPGGDNYLGASIKTVTDYLGASPTQTAVENFERGVTGSGYGGTFNGYTEGPGYWGKTFFVWPPPPGGSDLDATNSANHANNGAADWRQRFFFKQNTSTGTLYWLDHNNILFDPSGSPGTSSSNVTPILKMPNTTTTVTEAGANVTYRYCINYAAIFQWLRNSAPTHFPASMTTGRIKFYTSIPDPTGDSSFNSRFWTQNPMSDLSERFWKDYVDFMLGQVQTGANTYDNSYTGSAPYTACIGPGDMFAWGTVQIKQRPDGDYKATINNSGGYASTYSSVMNMNNVQTPSGTAIDLPGPNPITSATNATPIVITSNAHGLTAGQFINISGVLGNTAANNSTTAGKITWKVGTVTTNTFQILTTTGTNTTGNGTYTANSGSWTPAITAISNTTPITITTGAAHNIPSTAPATSGKFTINISGVNAAVNGRWTVTYKTATTFSLDGSTAGGTTIASTPQWWEPTYYVRLGLGTRFYELNPATVTSGTLSGSPDFGLKATVANSAVVQIYTMVPKYMDYADNPYRPKHQFWFGPMTFVDWLGNYTVNNLRWPGNLHEAQAWACKVGISSAIDDIQNNHPNDYVGMAFYSSPSYNTSGGGQHNLAVVPLGRSYQNLKDSLWFPPTTVSGAVSTITPYDADFANVPRAKGGTAPGMGFMLAYNLLSSSTANLRSFATPSTTYRGFDGGLGRKGASRLVVFETDGVPNTVATATIKNSAADSYYPIRIKDPTDIGNGSNEFPSSTGNYNTNVYSVVQQTCALDTASPPGYSSSRKTAYVYSIGYGSLFDPSTPSANQTTALTFLQSVQYYGNTATNTSGASFNDWQRIYGDTTTRQTRMQSAFTTIMQSGVQVSLLQ